MRMGRAVFFVAALCLGAVLTALPAQARQTFTQEDLSGRWLVFVYGAYETKTEHLFGTVDLDQGGSLVAGSNTYRGVENQFLGGWLGLNEDGQVSGGLQIETWALSFNFLRGQMDLSKTEITGFVTGQWYPCLIRMVKASGEPAPDPETDPTD